MNCSVFFPYLLSGAADVLYEPALLEEDWLLSPPNAPAAAGPPTVTPGPHISRSGSAGSVGGTLPGMATAEQPQEAFTTTVAGTVSLESFAPTAAGGPAAGAAGGGEGPPAAAAAGGGGGGEGLAATAATGGGVAPAGGAGIQEVPMAPVPTRRSSPFSSAIVAAAAAAAGEEGPSRSNMGGAASGTGMCAMQPQEMTRGPTVSGAGAGLAGGAGGRPPMQPQQQQQRQAGAANAEGKYPHLCRVGSERVPEHSFGSPETVQQQQQEGQRTSLGNGRLQPQMSEIGTRSTSGTTNSSNGIAASRRSITSAAAAAAAAAAAKASAAGGVAMGSSTGFGIGNQLGPGQMETSYSTTGERVLGAARAAHPGQATASTVSQKHLHTSSGDGRSRSNSTSKKPQLMADRSSLDGFRGPQQQSGDGVGGGWGGREWSSSFSKQQAEQQQLKGQASLQLPRKPQQPQQRLAEQRSWMGYMGSLSGGSAAGHEEEQGLSVSGMDWSRLEKPPEKKQQQQGGSELQPAHSLQQQSSFLEGVFRKQSLHSQQALGSTTSATPPGSAAAASVQDERSSFCTVDLPPEDQVTAAAAAPTGAYSLHGAGQTDGAGFDVEEALTAAADMGHGEAQADREAAAQEALVSEWQPDTNSAGDKW